VYRSRFLLVLWLGLESFDPHFMKSLYIKVGDFAQNYNKALSWRIGLVTTAAHRELGRIGQDVLALQLHNIVAALVIKRYKMSEHLIGIDLEQLIVPNPFSVRVE
jgi:hypothetical protein